jgi:hypothetical protein
MIKRIGALSLSLLYIVTVVGFALNLHYCFGYITSVKIDAPVKSCGIRATGKMKCCKDRHFEVKVKDAHQAATPSLLAKIFAFQLPRVAFADFSFNTQKGLLAVDFNKGPPDIIPDQHITFLKNCAFRI